MNVELLADYFLIVNPFAGSNLDTDDPATSDMEDDPATTVQEEDSASSNPASSEVCPDSLVWEYVRLSRVLCCECSSILPVDVV